MKELLIRVERKEISCAIVKDGYLSDLIVERSGNKQIINNIYRGVVINVLSNIQSAFININEIDNGFIHVSDIVENAKKLEKLFDMDFDINYELQSQGDGDDDNRDISAILKPNQVVLVQVVKEAIGNKGSRLTSNISLPGRFMVLLPNVNQRGVSKKIEDSSKKNKLRYFVNSLDLPEGIGIICRTASQDVEEEVLSDEVEELLEIWNGIVCKFNESSKAECLYEDEGLIKKSIIKALDKNFFRVIVDDYNTFQSCKKLIDKYGKQKRNLKIEYYKDRMPIFEKFNVEKKIEKALMRKIWLPSGGYLFFEQTEAMCTIDVNSGRSQSKNKKIGNIEESIVKINLEAAEEIARQLRLRNIGGLIICDFIDMKFLKNQKRIIEHLKESMKEDSAKCTILDISEFGLVEMTRQRSRKSLSKVFLGECPYCNNAGVIKTCETTFIEMERSLRKLITFKGQYAILISMHPVMLEYIKGEEEKALKKNLETLNAVVKFKSDDTLHVNDCCFFSLTNNQKLSL